MGTKIDRTSDSPHADFTPLEQVLVVRQNPETRQRESVRMQWGLVPSWAESPATGHRLIHARPKPWQRSLRFGTHFDTSVA